MIVVGNIEDQLSSLVWEKYSDLFLTNSDLLNFEAYKAYFIEFLHPLTSNQPLLWTFLSYLLRLGANSYNFFIVLTLVLSFDFFVYVF